MRLQYKFVTTHFDDDASAAHSVRRHYSALMEELRRQSPHSSLLQRSTQWRPPADMHETSDAILVKMELAGVREEDLTITLYEDALVVTGRRDDDLDPAAAICYHEAQIRYGPFRAEIMLPGQVRREGVEATYANGLLRILLPKAAGTARESVAPRNGLVERAASSTHPLQAQPAQLPIRFAGSELTTVPVASDTATPYAHGSTAKPDAHGGEWTGGSAEILAGLPELRRRASVALRGDLPDA